MPHRFQLIPLPALLLVVLASSNAKNLHVFAGHLDMQVVDGCDVFQYERTSAPTLKAANETRMPLDMTENTRIVVFRPLYGGLENIAIITGDQLRCNNEIV